MTVWIVKVDGEIVLRTDSVAIAHDHAAHLRASYYAAERVKVERETDESS